MTSAAQGRAGWFPDPAGRFDDRYWDGSNWTSAVKRGERVQSDPETLPVKFVAASDPASPTIPPPPSASELQTEQRVTPPPWPGADRLTSLPLAEAQREVVRLLQLAGIPVQNQQPGLVQASVPLRGETNAMQAILLGLAYPIVDAIRSSRTRMLPAAVQLATPSAGSTAITVRAARAPRQVVLSALATLP